MSDNSSKIVCVIPARGGSKGIKNKNLMDLGGRPLLHWSIEAAKQSGAVDRIIVSTESPAIANAARDAGAEVPYARPQELCEDHVHSVHVILDMLDQIETNESNPSANVMMLLPTSPFRTPRDIREAVARFRDKKAKALISVTETGKYMTNMRYIRDDVLIPVDREVDLNAQRQGLEPLFAVNGSIYIAQSHELRAARTFHMQGAVSHVMHPLHSIDINTPDDLALARLLQSSINAWRDY